MDPALRLVDLLSAHSLYYCNNIRRGLHRARAHFVRARTRTRVQALLELLNRRSSLISAYSLPVEI